MDKYNKATYLSFDDHIRELRKSIPGIRISYRPGYDELGHCIGVRGAIGDITGDSVRINDTFWLIAGDIYNKSTNKKIRSMREMKFADPAELCVHMRGQCGVCGCLVSATLGTYDIAELNYINDDLGFAILGQNK